MLESGWASTTLPAETSGKVDQCRWSVLRLIEPADSPVVSTGGKRLQLDIPPRAQWADVELLTPNR